MKQVQIKGNKVFIFEELELKERLGMKKDDIQLVLEYQRTFPELLQEDGKGYCIDARILHSQLVENAKGKDIVGSEFAKWIKRRIKKYDFIENEDFEVFVKKDDNPKGGRPTEEYKITLNMAKELCMIENNDKGRTARKYFILMENTLRSYEDWSISRGNEKFGWNIMEEHIKNWCERKGFDSSIRLFYIREANMINQNLLGYNASEINHYLNNDDKITRNHLKKEVNDAISFLQQLNCSLLFSDMELEDREKIVKNTCENRYSKLKEDFINFIKN